MLARLARAGEPAAGNLYEEERVRDEATPTVPNGVSIQTPCKVEVAGSNPVGHPAKSYGARSSTVERGKKLLGRLVRSSSPRPEL